MRPVGMPNSAYKVLLYLLRALVYLKRALVYLYSKFVFVLGQFSRLYHSTLGFFFYKIGFFLGRSLKKTFFSPGATWRDALGTRGALQIMILAVGLFTMAPFSKLYGQINQEIGQRPILLYTLAGPGEVDYDVEEANYAVDQSYRSVRSWREGAVSKEDGEVGANPNQMEQRELGGVMAGRGAITKPTIISGEPQPTGAATAPGKRTQTLVYEVEPGDVVSNIARKYGIGVSTILWANNLNVRSYIRPGDKLKILPADGIMYVVKRGDTIAKIAKTFRAEGVEIIAYNNLQPDGSNLVAGAEILIPNGEIIPQPVKSQPASKTFQPLREIVAPASSIEIPAGAGYVWPTAVKRITQYFGWRHTGMDIAGPVGTPIYAARSGTVIKSQCGWNGGYGCYIIIEHGNGLQTLYGHQSQLYSNLGESVEQGQTIGLMGSTGRSTGPHVHFEVRSGSRKYNPLKYLR